MKNFNSEIYNVLNSIIGFIQSKTDKLRQSSLLLSNIDIFILLSILATFVVSLFAKTEIIGAVSFFVPALVVLKVLITKGEKIELERCNFYLLAYLIICLISNFTSSMLPQSLYGYMKTLIYFAFYFALCQFLKANKRFIFVLLIAIAVLVGFEAVIGVMQDMLGLEVAASWQDLSYVNPEDVLSRVYGTLKPYNPNLYAAYMIAGISSFIGLALIFIHRKSYKLAILSVLLFAISAFAIFISGCRGAYIALFVMILGLLAASFQYVFFDLKDNRLMKWWKYIVSAFVAFSAAFILLNHGILQRILSIFILREDSSTSFRMNVYNSAFQMLHDNFLCGIGVGNKVFREIYGLYMLSGFDALSCYSVFLEIAVESGIFALIAYLLFLLSLIKDSIVKFVSTKDFVLKVLIFTTCISVVAVMIHGFVDTVYFRPQVQYIFWTMAAILTVVLKDD